MATLHRLIMLLLLLAAVGLLLTLGAISVFAHTLEACLTCSGSCKACCRCTTQLSAPATSCSLTSFWVRVHLLLQELVLWKVTVTEVEFDLKTTYISTQNCSCDNCRQDYGVRAHTTDWVDSKEPHGSDKTPGSE